MPSAVHRYHGLRISLYTVGGCWITCKQALHILGGCPAVALLYAKFTAMHRLAQISQSHTCACSTASLQASLTCCTGFDVTPAAAVTPPAEAVAPPGPADALAAEPQ